MAPLAPPQRPIPPVPAQPASPAPAPASPTAAAGAVKVALLVPMSGPNAELGKAILQAAQLALFQAGGDRLNLLPRDSGGTADAAANAARSAVADGARLILGPLLAVEVEAVRPIARDAKLNVIAFSTATQLAGGNVFLMGFLPRQEIVREVGFARERSLSRFAALAPNSAYGHLIADALRDSAGAAGGSVVRTEFYEPRAAADAPAAIQRLLRPAAPQGGATNFDALVLPEGGARLKQIGQQLKSAGLDTAQVRLLGSGLWDDPSIAGEPALYGGWFAASPPEGRREFEQRYQSTYGRAPPRLASLGFDSAALAAVLAKIDGADPFSAQAIENPSGFTGVDGLFRFTAAGLVQRGLAVLEVQPQGNVVISPAPASFQDIGY
jgi:branched-chain amino acid transport system substrate-binding protein